MSLSPSAAPGADAPDHLSPFLRRFVIGLCVCFALYGGVYIWKTSFVIDGERYFCLFDDAMISMHYARNLARGAGLRWNPGETPVEGFTNPLWVIFMAGLHLLPIPITKISLLVQATSLGLLTANIVMTARLANVVSRGSAVATATAAVGTAFYFPLVTWALQGMEVGALVLTATAATWLVARRESIEKRTIPWGLYALLGFATFIRVDAVVFGAVLTVWLALRERSLRVVHLTLGLGILVGCIGGQTLFRHWYFGMWLPNTYYLKMTGYPALPRIMHGLAMWWGFVRSTTLIFFLICLIPLVWLRRNLNIGLVAAVLFAQFAYSIYVGGDAWEWFGGANRYISVGIPMFFILAGLVVAVPLARVTTGSRLWVVAVGAGLVGVIALPNFLRTPQALGESLLQSRTIHWTGNEMLARAAKRLSPFCVQNTRVAVYCAGTTPYFLDCKAIDLLGKCDGRISRLAMRRTKAVGRFDWGEDFYPGHMKYDFEYSIGVLNPDVIIMPCEPIPEKITPDYSVVGEIVPLNESCSSFIQFRKGSPNLRLAPQAR